MNAARPGLRGLCALGFLGCLFALALPAGAAPVAGVTSLEPTVAVRAIWGRHARYIVEVNAKGQVSKVRERSRSRYPQLDALTYGNVVQIFVRTKEGARSPATIASPTITIRRRSSSSAA